ncbi:MAG: isoprenylcysteine carboxylmethyltransferase family protein [Terracidiphilus sp.]
MSLGRRVTVRAVVLLALALGMIFVPAGSFRYWQGWAFLAAFFLPGLFAFIYFLTYDRELVARRLRHREKTEVQERPMRWGFRLFLVAFLLPGFDFRWGWSRRLFGGVPVWLTITALATVVGGFLLVWWTLKVNSFAGRTIEVEAGQTVISSGPYTWVRHPMYAGSLLVWVSTPLALGSWVALPAFASLIPFYALRLLNEEKVLRAELPGYPEYCLKTRYRLIPFLW